MMMKSYLFMIGNKTVFTHIDSVFETKEIRHFSLWTFAQPHGEILW